jgi:hypothetical protein
VTWYGKTAAISAAAFTCPWPSVFGIRAVTVVLIRNRSQTGYDLALVTTGTAATAAQGDRTQCQQVADRGRDPRRRPGLRRRAGPQPRARAVARTVPFQLACQAITTLWYATAGYDLADVADHRARAPWYTTKAQPSTADVAAKLRHVIASRFKAFRPARQHPKKSASSAWPGRTQRHNGES